MKKILLISIACCILCTMGMSLTTGRADQALVSQCMAACAASQNCSDMHVDQADYCKDATAYFAEAEVWQCVSAGSEADWDVTLADCVHN